MTKKFIIAMSFLVLVSLSLDTVGCGYILHPERRKAHTNRIDPLTVTFDALWILAGVIPGVVALIVDGVKDTWYFAPGEKAELVPTVRHERFACTVFAGGHAGV